MAPICIVCSDQLLAAQPLQSSRGRLEAADRLANRTSNTDHDIRDGQPKLRAYPTFAGTRRSEQSKDDVDKTAHVFRVQMNHDESSLSTA